MIYMSFRKSAFKDGKNCFLYDVECIVRETVDIKGYARRKDVRLKLWRSYRLGKKATNFMLDMLEAHGKIRQGNRGIYITERGELNGKLE